MGGTPEAILACASWENIPRADLNTRAMQGLLRTVLVLSPCGLVGTSCHGLDTKNPRHGHGAKRLTGRCSSLCCALRSRPRGWTQQGITTRSVRGVSGRNGEHWSAIGAGWVDAGARRPIASAEEAQAAIEAEIGSRTRPFSTGSRRARTVNSIYCVFDGPGAHNVEICRRHGLLEEDACNAG